VAIAIGAFLNAIGILLGALFGLALRKPLSLRAQVFLRSALGAFTIFFGLRLVYENVGGSFLSCLKQIFLALLAIVLGFWIGKLSSLQKISNRFGRVAGNCIAAAQKNPAQNSAGGFSACAILFCAAPLGLLGAVADGLSGYFWLLAVKGVMDGLAMTSFVKMFRWPAALSAIPVFVFLGAISLACQFYAKPFLDLHGMTGSVNAAAGLVACAVALVIFEVRRVELANFLPALAVAPLLAMLFK
jgi:uncharacterized membrane protein YqgA involved in biofilm formation